MSETKKGGILGGILSFVKEAKIVDFVRPAMYKLGGRKLVTSGAALFVIERVVSAAGESLSWAHAIVCLSVAIVAGAFAFATASEDKGKAQAKAKTSS